MSLNTAYLSLGANIGDKLANLRAAARMIGESESCAVVAASSLYITRPVGVEDQPDFMNAVIAVKTDLTPADLLKLCNDIEERLGRRRTIRWGPRVIDIDILLYDDIVVDEDNLVIPHPRMMERAFVLVPLAEIAPDIRLPEGLTAREAAAGVDQSGIELAQVESWSE